MHAHECNFTENVEVSGRQNAHDQKTRFYERFDSRDSEQDRGLVEYKKRDNHSVYVFVWMYICQWCEREIEQDQKDGVRIKRQDQIHSNNCLSNHSFSFCVHYFRKWIHRKKENTDQHENEAATAGKTMFGSLLVFNRVALRTSCAVASSTYGRKH